MATNKVDSNTPINKPVGPSSAPPNPTSNKCISILKTLGKGSVKVLSSIAFAILLPIAIVFLAAIASLIGLSILLTAPFILISKKLITKKGMGFLNHSVATFFDIFSIMRATIFYGYDLTKQNPSAAFARQQVAMGAIPNIYVHGYCHDSSAWIKIVPNAQKNGLSLNYTINLGYPFQTIDAYALKLNALVNQIMAETGATQVNLVGHSMGGVVCSHFATTYAKPNSVKKVITIGSPLNGTLLAKIGIGPNAREMEWNSSFSQTLQGKIANATQIQFTHLASDADILMIPRSTSYTTHAHSRSKVYHLRGHVSYLYANSVVDEVVTTLKS